MKSSQKDWLINLQGGVAIPASPLALNARRRFDERRQRALFRYYAAAGSGGIAVGVHTTQFAIRDPKIGLFRPILELGREELDRADTKHKITMVRVAGICGKTPQATKESKLIRDLGYHAGLLSLAAMRDATEAELLKHCRAVAEITPVIGFYLQPAVGGRVLPYSFWRQFAEIQNVVAIKMAPFNRYQTIDVVRAVIEAGRDDIALYTGNDDNIVLDLLTPYRLQKNGQPVERRIVGGLLGHWSVWTRNAAQLLKQCHRVAKRQNTISRQMLRLNIEVTDSNAVFFDAANAFAGCIAGLHEVLRRQGLLEGVWCLDPEEKLSPGQSKEIDRVYRAYPHLHDDVFVASHLDEWLR